MRRLLPLILTVLLVASCASDVSTPLPPLDSAQAYIERGNSLGEEGHYLEALDHFSAAIELEPDNAEAYFLRGRAHYDYAVQVIVQATGQRPENASFLPDEALRHLEEAVADYTKAIEFDPRHTRAYNNRGNAYISLGELESALRDYNTALELDPDLTLTYFNRGLLHYQLGNHEQAIADLEMYLELVPDAEDRSQVEDFIERLREESGPPSQE
jgi:tetratricopeptide (TPR) repeat protein